ncbi:MAG: glycosyltransferase family 2 protein [Patescibacteria group bacterium]
MPEYIVKSRLYARLSETIVPILTWVIITLPLWLSPFHPAIVAYFIISFDTYFFYKSAITVYYAVISYKAITKTSKVSFRRRILSLKPKHIQHFIIIPNYKEPIYKLEATIKSIVDTDYPYKKLSLVLAFEKREAAASSKASKLKRRYKKYFKDVLVTYHKLEEGEEEGKASNQTFAAKQVNAQIEESGIDRKDILITICDADSILPKNYFSYLTYQYVKDKDRQYHFYWAPVLLYNNFWKLPFFVRMQATLSSILRLSFLSQSEKLIQISTYSTNLWLLDKIGFWDVDIIPEDWHIYYQAFFKFGDKVRTIPLYTLINGDAVYSGGIFKTLVNRYEQEKRWASGASDIGYFLKNIFTTGHIKFGSKLKKFIFLAETHLFWPISFFILTISAIIPPLINPTFRRTVLGFILPQLASAILTLTTIAIIVYIYLDIKLRKKFRQKTKLIKLPLLIIQWYMLPLVSFVLSSLPALDAHTRLILGKKLKYKVTEKV